ncbi:MAG TPA: hypothetical protein VG711_02160 [Phycisphaerales bacterium]|nr:hypothetical protein [Phycisphaerales bacterium]
MFSSHVIIGIGEAVWNTNPPSPSPAGLAPLVAIRAAQVGHVGIPISRLGQDNSADALLASLQAAKVSVNHLQSDPDLPTAVYQLRRSASSARTLIPNAAFDVLQWDFDLVDVAQRAAAVVYGQIARRNWQSRSVIKQFLLECTSAIRLFDLTNREGSPPARADIATALELATSMILDSAAFSVLSPGVSMENSESLVPAALKILKSHDLDSLTLLIPNAGVHLFTPNHHTYQPVSSPLPDSSEAIAVALLTGMLDGDDPHNIASLAAQAWKHLAADRTLPLPSKLQGWS